MNFWELSYIARDQSMGPKSSSKISFLGTLEKALYLLFAWKGAADLCRGVGNTLGILSSLIADHHEELNEEPEASLPTLRIWAKILQSQYEFSSSDNNLMYPSDTIYCNIK